MKKILCAFLTLVMLVSLAGCGDVSTAKPQNSSGNTVSAVMQQQMNQSNTEQTEETQPPVPQESTSGKNDALSSAEVDVDLTKLSSTMVYSEVYNMMTAPKDYIGKKVKMNGKFAIFRAEDENGQPVPGMMYFACVIADATACCQQGIEFVLGGGAQFPDDYPSPGTDITVVGEFGTYVEDGYMYCHLTDAQFI